MYRYLVAGLAIGAFLLSLATFLARGQAANASLDVAPGQAVAGLDVDCSIPQIKKSFNLINSQSIEIIQGSGQGSYPCVVHFPFNVAKRYIIATAYAGIYVEPIYIRVRTDRKSVEIWFNETGTGRANLIVY